MDPIHRASLIDRDVIVKICADHIQRVAHNADTSNYSRGCGCDRTAIIVGQSDRDRKDPAGGIGMDASERSRSCTLSDAGWRDNAITPVDYCLRTRTFTKLAEPNLYDLGSIFILTFELLAISTSDSLARPSMAF